MKNGISGQDAANVFPGFIERNILDPDSRIKLPGVWQPRFNIQRAGIVGCRRKHSVFVEAVEHLAQVL